MSIIKTLLLLSILTLSPLTHALEEALGTPTTVTSSPIAQQAVKEAATTELNRLHKEAKQAYFQSNYPLAIEKWQAGLDQARQLASKRYISQFLGNLGIVYEALSQHPKALEYHQQALAIDRELGDKYGEASDLNNLGMVYQNLSQYPKALEYHQQALAIAKELGNKRGEGSSLTNLGVVYQSLSQYDKALEYDQQALTIHKEFGDKRKEGGDLSNLGMVYEELGQHLKALEYDQQALAIHRELGDKLGEGINLTNLGAVYRSLGQSPKALEYHQQALVIFRELGDKHREGINLSNLGAVYEDLEQYPKALEYDQQALAIHRELGDKLREGRDLGNLGLVYENLGQHLKALEYNQQALAIAKELDDKRGEGNALSNFGVVYQNLSQYDKALEYHQQALVIHRELSDKRHEGHDLGNLGVVYLNLGQYPKALEYYQQALAIRREIGDKRGEGDNLTNLGVVYLNLGQYPKALEYEQQALTIAKELSDKHGEANALNNLGAVYEKLGQYPKALEYDQQALAIHKELGDKHGEGSDLTNIGMVYGNLGQYPKALEYYQQALDIHHKLGDKREEGHDLGDLGVVYDDLGQYQQALKYYKQALAIDKELGDKEGEGITLSNLSGVYVSLSQYPKALEYLQQALVIFRELGNKRGEGLGLGNLGIIYEKLDQYPKALEYYQQALVILRELGDKRGEGSNLTNLGLVYVKLGQYDQAKTYFQDSITIQDSLGNLDGLYKAQGGLAATEVYLKQSKDAIYHLEQALNIIEQLRASLTGGIEEATKLPARTLKTNFMQDKFVVYDGLIYLYHDQGDDQKAFETFERKQGRAFLEDMAQSGVRRYVDLPEEISDKEKFLETQVENARKTLGEAAGKGDEAVKSARELLATAETARNAFQAELKVKYPHYYALKHPQPVKLPDLQQNVLQDGELLLIYNVREEATDLWLVDKQHFQMFSLPLTEAQVKEQVAKFRQTGVDSILKEIKETKELAEEDRRTRMENAVEDSLPDFLNISAALYQQLLPESVRQLLKAAKPNTLYIVPTGALYSLPFEALVMEKGESPHYLIQDYAVSYLSSASLLKTLRDAKQPRHTEAQQPLLAFAHPVYDKTAFAKLCTEDLRTRTYLKLVSGDKDKDDDKAVCGKYYFPELPETAKEATDIAKVLKADEHYLKLRKEASKQQVLQVLKEPHLDNFQYVLFAAHAVAPEKVTPLEQPALILSLTTPDQDAYLTMADVFEFLSLKADLVTLSACNTGQGELVHGEGVLGLTRAFMYAGTPAVSVTLWNIETHSSQALTTGLFTQLKEQKQLLAAGLRQTKLSLLTGGPEEYYRHPYFWAGMVVFGDGK